MSWAMGHGKGGNELKLETTGATLTSRFRNFLSRNNAIGFPPRCDRNE